jgi:hypothetical protein
MSGDKSNENNALQGYKREVKVWRSLTGKQWNLIK